MKNKSTVVLAGLLALSASALRADIVETLKHPIKAYHEHSAKNDEAMAGRISQERKIAKDQMDMAHDEYHTNLKKYGAANDQTEKSKTRYVSARENYRRLIQKGRENAKEVNNDLGKVQQD